MDTATKREHYIDFPDDVVRIAKILADRGHPAYAVGGCVRDSIMGRVPSDWDMTTDAKPEEMLNIFQNAGLHTIPTGLKHGTVTVMIDKKPFEITTFRIDGEYTDSRRPNNVTFSKDVSEDLKRRDFTVNAMAADPLCNKHDNNTNCEIVDLFGGLEDIENHTIRCVGNPFERFSEDALRILRAVRFASVLGFNIESDTLASASALSYKLADISAERKAVELEKTLLSNNADKGFDTLCKIGAAEYIHSQLHAPCVALASLPKRFSARLAALVEGEKKISLACMKLSGEITREATLLADRAFFNECCRFFGDDMGANARFMISKYGALAEAAAILRNDDLLLSAITTERDGVDFATKISDLDVNGNILMSAGISQKSLGKILSRLLLDVIKDPSLNRQEILIQLSKELYEKGE